MSHNFFSRRFLLTLPLLLLGLAIGLSRPAQAANSSTLFEGIYRVTLHSQHVGYAIQRYEYDTKKKQFISTMYVRTSPAAGNLIESLKAYASQALNPISYQYTATVGDKVTTIDATFKLRNVRITALKDGKRQTASKTLPENVFLSTFLYYRIMNSPQGLSVGTKYDFNALAEEEATIYSGESWVQKLTTWQKNTQAYQVLNQFKNSKYITILNSKGEILATHSPAEGLRTELVATLTEAAGPFPVNKQTLQLLFGEVPSGLNDLTRSAEPPIPQDAKQGPSLPKQRVFIKGAPPADTESTMPSAVAPTQDPPKATADPAKIQEGSSESP